MNPLVISIEDFLKKHNGCYLNPHSIDFTILKGSIMLDFSEVDEREGKYIELSIVYSSKNVQKFMRDFNIAHPSDLGKITVEHLWALFYKEFVEIQVCIGKEIDAPFMRYKYFNNQLITMHNSKGAAYVVEKPLKTYSDFISYTLMHFEKYLD